MAYSDRELLARLIECEAGGEGDSGMKAVASVVMNRVEAAGGEYGVYRDCHYVLQRRGFYALEPVLSQPAGYGNGVLGYRLFGFS